jgi:putative MATE family efflux protein
MAHQMLDAPPLPLLLRLAAPNALAFLVQAAVSIAEIAFVGRLGTVPLAALALMFPGVMLMQMLANGAIGGAVSSAVARSIGGGAIERGESLIWHALAIAFGGGLTFALVWWTAGASLLPAVGATGPIADAATDYAAIVFTCAPLIWLTGLASSVFRGMGNMKLPAALMILGALVQVPLAGALILGWFGLPQLGIAGAAVALMLVSGVNGAVLLVRLARGSEALALRRARMRFSVAQFADIFRVGALASVSPVLTVATIGAVNTIVAGFGAAALAGYGIVARLEFLLVPMVFGLGAAMTAMVGTNVGAGNIQRAERIGWLGGGTAAAITGVVGLALALVPALWLGLFTNDAAIWQAGESYLRIVGPLFAFQGLGVSLYFASQGAGTVFWPVVATVLRFIVGVGGALLAVHVFAMGLASVYVCLAVGMFVYGVLTAASLRLGAWRP